MAKLYFRYGAMGSSKTANAIMVQYNYQERNQRVLMVKPALENRDGERTLKSRCGLSAECVFMEELDDALVQQHDCVIVDEARSHQGAGGISGACGGRAEHPGDCLWSASGLPRGIL